MGPRGRKFLSLIAVSLFEDVRFFCVTGAYAAEATRLVHKNLDCSVCHTTAGKTFETPESKTCIGCHGGMDAIKLKSNAFKKDAHHSPHYADWLECTQCHAEHKPAKSLCQDCHVMK